MNDATRAGLLARFKHLNLEKCGTLFHVDQPEDGLFTVDGSKYPGVRMRNGAKWFYVKDQRPLNKQGQPLKSKAPKGTRRMLYDTVEPAELLAVEGEGHALACCSIGLKGVVCVGGVNTLLTNKPDAREHRRQVFQGKSVRLLFDPDEAGQAAVTKAARSLLEAGAVRVAIVMPEALPESWLRGMDVEDWLASFDTPEAATVDLMQLLGATNWDDAKDPDDEDKDHEVAVQSERLFTVGEAHPVLVVMVYDEDERKASLAVFGPEDIGRDGELTEHQQKVLNDYPDRNATEDADRRARAWRVMDTWRCGHTHYMPDTSQAVMKYLENRTLVLPSPPHEGADTSELLWQDLRAFMQRWVLMDTEQYDVLVAYTLLTYRLQDAHFNAIPYLRFYGPPATGKGRALDVMQVVCWRSFSSQPTADNIHRLVEYFGDITLIFDEFHLDRGLSKDAQDKLIDTLALGNKRGQGKIRVEKDARGNLVLKHFDLFGLKVFAGYGHDEHESLARRTVNVEMRQRKVPESMSLFALPPEFYKEAAALRGRLLSWRGRKLELGMPDPGSSRAKWLLREVGPDTGQVFWPLLEMVPGTMKAELENLMACAMGRKAGTQAAREVSEESYLLDAVTQLWDEGEAHRLEDGTWFMTTEDIYERAVQRAAVQQNTVAKRLQALGLTHGRHRVDTHAGIKAKRGGVVLRPGDANLKQVFNRYGLEWPRQAGGVKRGEAPI